MCSANWWVRVPRQSIDCWWCRATRAVGAGDELCMAYGMAYWAQEIDAATAERQGRLLTIDDDV